MDFFAAMNISGSGMTAEALRMEVIANNIANLNTTRTPEGGPYQRKRVIFAPRATKPGFNIPFIKPSQTPQFRGVRVIRIEGDPSPFRLTFQPDHPDADKEGYVRFPNVNVVTELTDMITATRAYEANVAVLSSSKSMMMKALEIGR